MLSAVTPEKMVEALARVREVVKPGGHILIRDYGVCDLAHVRFMAKQGRKLDENFYLRGGLESFFIFIFIILFHFYYFIYFFELTLFFLLLSDGTRAYFFSTEKLRELVEKSGFVVEKCEYDSRELKNRKRKILMRRVWVHLSAYRPIEENKE